MAASFAQLKSAFIGHCQRWGHLSVASSPVKAAAGDNELLFNNSGMAPLKMLFTSGESTESPLCSVQKCVRLGGKHNDYANIGVSKRHLSFFEMMGAFSFGSYGRRYAIEMIWSLVLRLGIRPQRVVVTVGSADSETYAAWKAVAGADCCVVTTYGEQNVWRVGDTGLCGACTEVFVVYDSSYWELLNVVFVSHELRADGCVKLARECVDVGVGVERTLAVINQSFDVYKEIGADDASLAAAFGTGFGRSLRTVVDHLRCASFIAFEGTTPAATGAGYVLRKLVRRSVTEIMTSSPAPDALAAFKTLASLVIDSRRAVDSATAASKSKILRVLALEAKVFVDSLARGMRRALKFNGAGGLHATHGVPKALVGTVASCVTYATPVKAVVSARCERALALTKTSVHAGVGRQVGGVGVVVSATGSAYVQRGALHHTILCESGEALASGQNVWVVSNDFVTSMTACAHTGLHALLALASRFVMGVNLKSTSVSYLGFCFEAAVDGAPLVVCALAQLLKLADVGVTTCVWYTKRRGLVRKHVRVAFEFGPSFEEECCGVHVASLNLNAFSYSLRQVGAGIKLVAALRTDGACSKQEADVDGARVEPKATRCVSLPNALRLAYVSANALNLASKLRTRALKLAVCVVPSLLTLCLRSPAHDRVLRLVAPRTKTVFVAPGVTAVRFATRLALACGLRFVRSAFCFSNE